MSNLEQSTTITVNELIEILKLFDPESLISFETAYSMPSSRAWDNFTMFADNKSVICAEYKRGDLTKVRPYIQIETKRTVD